MRFVTLEISNFLSFGEKQVISLADRGLVAIFGQNKDSINADSNGSGKSTLVESIVWVLWGDTLRGYKADEVVNKTVGKDCCVSLIIEDSNNTYKITRTRKMSGCKHPNDLQLLINGMSTTAGVTADTQIIINTVLGMDQKTFVQSVLLCHGTKPFSELTDAAQKEVLEDILQINQFAYARDIVNQKLKDRQNNLAVINTQIQQITLQISTLEQRQQQCTELCKSHAASILVKNNELLRRKAKCEMQIEDHYHNEGLDILLDTMKDMDEKIAQCTKKEDEITKNILTAYQLSNQNKNEILQKRVALTSVHLDNNDACSTINNLVGKPCPTCRRMLAPDEAEEMLGSRDSQNQLIADKIFQLNAELDGLTALEQQTIAALGVDKTSIRNEVTKIRSQQQLLYSKIQQRNATLQNICQLEQQVFLLSLELEKLQNENNPYEQLVIAATNELNDLYSVNQRVSYKQRALDLEIQHLLFWDRGFGNHGIKSFVIEGVLPFLNERAQHYADLLSGGDFHIEFTTQKQLKNGQKKEEFQVRVLNQQGADIYKGNSAGERRRIDIAVGWALGDLAATRSKKSIRLKCLDEPFESLDETGEDSVIKLLHAVLPQYETILCITHSDHLRNQFPNTLCVVKQGGFSRIN